MTERLAALLREEASRLDVPAPPVHEALAEGHRVRRRRTLTRVVAVAATVGVVAGVGVGTAALMGGDSPRPPIDGQVADPAPDESGDLGPAFSSGSTVYLDEGATPVAMPEIAQTIYYTSAGYLVRTNQTGNSDGGAPFHFVLVSPDGTSKDLALTLGEVVPSTDAQQPYIAFAETDDAGQTQVVVVDVTTGERVASVAVPGQMTWGGWSAPPVALDGDLVYVGTDEVTTVVDWRTGEVSTSDLVAPGYPTVHGGRALLSLGEGKIRIVDVNSGATLFESSGKGFPWARLSPDGRFATVQDQVAQQPSTEVYDLDTGTHVALQNRSGQLGWATDDTLFGVSAAGFEKCSATTGTCTTTPLPDSVDLADFMPLSGSPNES